LLFHHIFSAVTSNAILSTLLSTHCCQIPSTCQTLQNNIYVKDDIKRKPNTNMNNTLLKEEICQLRLGQSVPNDKSAI